MDGADLAPLPSLLVIIDEFTELLSSRPDFIDLFVMIGRLGRSLAIHLLLASQRLEEGRLRGLDSHLSYRIGLRTFSAAESRTVLGVADAYTLPPVPGSAYLKSDTESLVRLNAAYVSGDLPARGQSVGGRTARPGVRAPVHAGPRPRAPPPVEATPTMPAPRGVITESANDTIMGAMVARMVGRGPAAHQIWLPPLDEPPSLDQLLTPLDVDPQRGLCPVGWGGNGRLTVPIAIVDKPFEQRRDLLWADLSGAAGHAIVVGAPQSGKSTLLRTLISSIAVTHTPDEAQFFLLDMGGGALGSIAGLPHVVRLRDPARPRARAPRRRRAVTLLAQREQFFAPTASTRQPRSASAAPS